MIYPNSISKLETELANSKDTPLTALAARIIEGAKAYDLKKTENLGVNFKLGNIARNQEEPPHITTEEVSLSSWSDNVMGSPLEDGEEWNKGRRATNTGIIYDVHFAWGQEGMSSDDYEVLLDHKKQAYVTNPYMNTGLEGFGCLGHAGPNHAVDNGILLIKPDKQGRQALHAIGIIRKYDNDAPAFSGGFAKYKKSENGTYTFDREAVIETQVEEFFEEMISGSVDLLPEYRDQLPLKLAMETQIQALSIRNPRIFKRDGSAMLSEERIRVLQTEIETELKLEQVRDKDPEFLERLFNMFAKGHECFSGPVLNDNRNTNNSWIETRLSWVFFDNATWENVRGSTPAFDYQLSSGDDASGVVAHKIAPELMHTAFASHGPMFAFMAASFLLQSQKDNAPVDNAVIVQLDGLATFFEQSKTDQTPNLDLSN